MLLFYLLSLQKINIKFALPIFAFFVFTLYFFSNQIVAGISTGIFGIVGLIGMIFSKNLVDLLITMSGFFYLFLIFYGCEKFINKQSEKKVSMDEEKENLENSLQQFSEMRESLTKKNNNLNARLENYSSFTELIVSLGSTFDEQKVLSETTSAITRFIPKGKLDIFFQKSDPIANEVFENNGIILVTDISYSKFRKVGDCKSCIAAPLTDEKGTFGVAVVKSEDINGFEESDLRMLTSLCDVCSIALTNAKLFEKTEELAITDGLSGLYVRRYFMERLTEYLASANRFSYPLSLIMLDIDHFKKVNDTYGHDAGDTVIKQIAAAIKKQTRETDIAVRYGGEEFVIILPYTKLDEAKMIAERTRQFIEQNEIVFERERIKITASFGVAEYQKGYSLEEFLKICDGNLYKAKERGRNNVV